MFNNKQIFLFPLLVAMLICSSLNGYCCQQEGATCQNNSDASQQCCTELKCWNTIDDKEPQEDEIGECIKDDTAQSNDE